MSGKSTWGSKRKVGADIAAQPSRKGPSKHWPTGMTLADHFDMSPRAFEKLAKAAGVGGDYPLSYKYAPMQKAKLQRFRSDPKALAEVTPAATQLIDGMLAETGAQADIATTCDAIKAMLLTKNKKYGNSAFEPLGIFTKELTPAQGIGLRVEDKLKRIRNTGYVSPDEDTLADLIGYLILLKIITDKERK